MGKSKAYLRELKQFKWLPIAPQEIGGVGGSKKNILSKTSIFTEFPYPLILVYLKRNIKIIFIILMIFASSQSTQGQLKSLEEPFAYRFNGHIKVYLLDEKSDNFKYLPNSADRKIFYGENSLFYKSGIYYENLEEEKKLKYYKISPVKYEKSILVPQKDYSEYDRSIDDLEYKNGSKLYRNNCNGNNCKKHKNTVWIVEKEETISVKDQNKTFLVESIRFDELELEGFIYKEYQMSDWDVDYGAQLSLPFKLRPKLNGDNMRITPEINLGGFLSSRYRIDRRKNRYLHFPIVSAGVSGIGVNTDNVIDESKNTGDGLIMATTFTVGTAVELGNFQLGLIMGWDKASGAIGANWQYNGRLWYSFGIGFTFLNRKKEETSSK